MFTTCLAFGVGGMIGTFVAQRISGAHLNPAASLAQAIDGNLAWISLPVYFAAQYLGGALAALLLFANYYEAISALDGGAHVAVGSDLATGSIFATYPGSHVSLLGALGDQVLGTAVLVFALSAVCDPNNANLPASCRPFGIALTIALTCVAFSPNCGAIFNPARDLAPRLVTAMLGYSGSFSSLNNLYWLVAGVVGPHIGAIIGHFGYSRILGFALANSNSLSKVGKHKRACPAQEVKDQNCLRVDITNSAALVPSHLNSSSTTKQPDTAVELLSSSNNEPIDNTNGAQNLQSSA